MTTPTRQFHKNMTLPRNGEIFVFGSNRAGYHGAGAAAIANKYYGAPWLQGVGRMGQSYAIPTKGHHLYHILTLAEIQAEVERFCQYTRDHPDLQFFVTAVGCGYAGHEHAEIAPMFSTALNCSFPLAWKKYLSPTVGVSESK